MLLDSLKPDSRPAVCEELAQALTTVEQELSQYDRALLGELDDSQRLMVEQLRTRRARTATMLRARLDALRHACYHDDPAAVLARTLQVA